MHLKVTKIKSANNNWWAVRRGRKTVGEIVYQMIAPDTMMYLPLVKVDDGKAWRALRNVESLYEAVDLIEAAIEPVTTAPVTDRIAVMGCGLSQKKTDELAAAIRKRL